MIKQQYKIKKGNFDSLNFEFSSDNLSYTFEVDNVSVYPEPGDTYAFVRVLFFVTSVDVINNTITAQSSTNNTIQETGQLIKATGSGDSTINFTTHTSTNFVDLTNHTFQVKIGGFYDSGILPTVGAPSLGVFFVNLPSATTKTFPIGDYKGAVELINSQGEVTEFCTFTITIIQDLI